MEIPVIYEDNHLLVVEKPVNVPVQEDQSGDPDLLTLLKQYLKVRYNKPGNVYLGLVHRLDRPVGGVIVFAKTSKAASRLSDAFRRHDVGREYIAAVRGRMGQKAGQLEHYLAKDRKENRVSVVGRGHPEGKKAILDYETVGQSKSLSLLKVRLLTGRPHQIRVQLSASGCPLYGDQKYGANINRPGQQLALWARTLSFEHPVKKEEMVFESLPPPAEPWTRLLLSPEMSGKR
ncbi:RluA family pseudouridine synthase [Edaphobacillus lindanitolerans]|uniref:RNA pseudouridylate synthase n=1 Tax=Edaphobacillus lindanitolerans TaxID=550447 RepID=A0A1U7PNE1_9BACI|nr:RluA family pseudouridine synthase [Edaphobacillus lindanitolerans]SIT92693.1 ribosomal large subunit pseudouridine synthase D [Edaphobacillus lindanitolerans]